MSSMLVTELKLMMLVCDCGGMLAGLQSYICFLPPDLGLLLKHTDCVSAAQVEPLNPEPCLSPSSTSPCPFVKVRGQS